MTATETEIERTVREEQQAHDEANETTEDDEQQPGEGEPDAADDDDETPADPDAAGQTAVFDKSQYDREDLQIQKVDGNTIDRISLKFSGEVFLDRSDPSDVAVYNELKLGRDVQILIEAKCSSTGAKGATDRDGDLDVVVGTKGLKVHSLRKPAGADWVEDAA
jgi:hypothetical protein